MASSPASAVPARATDGRHRRSERSRDSIVTAMLDLVAAGAISPSAEEVAARAGVGLRSVFRHFRDMESLFQAMQMRLAQIYQVWLIPFSAVGWRGQLDELIDRRLSTYEQLLPYMRAADVHRHRSASIYEEHGRIRTVMRARLAMVVDNAFVDDADGFEALDLLVSPETWQRLRLVQALSPENARRIIERQVERVLSAQTRAA
ncbi:TetR/AcrR family transcriptional regulator [Polymorphobacter sp. PAMC 29334]|uniref:TetR/AcrR family transcriptional regulator n=1 Tax=Polymorphobacter sp. PAMC 29334 TaxID=2862331 RepID=UPI001C67A5B0|nr:TetR/AcrR family transcriptional regulator [Polymorphobacter sp. PAMC 29334]QYE34625.1 TetR/AcrR family transcriptional regulator [Polymorphobacter sp. PAMC 29334]